MTAVALRRSQWIPWVFVAAFVVVAAVNGVLIWSAITSSPGLVADHAYELGRHYNQELAAARAQASLGWTASLDVADGEAVFAVTGRDGAPIAGLDVDLVALRPVGAGEPLAAKLVEATPGRYRAPLALTRAGQWQLDLVARRGAAEFVLGKRILVK